MVIQTIGFTQIENVEAHCFALVRVRDSEEEPLGVALGVDVIL